MLKIIVKWKCAQLCSKQINHQKKKNIQLSASDYYGFLMLLRYAIRSNDLQILSVFFCLEKLLLATKQWIEKRISVCLNGSEKNRMAEAEWNALT